jgi:hypothetical protein
MASKAVANYLGVATSANVIAVKSWDHAIYAYTSDIVAGITYITAAALQSKRPSVANFSWSCEYTNALAAAAASAILAGVHIVAAAGNLGIECIDFPSQSE